MYACVHRTNFSAFFKQYNDYTTAGKKTVDLFSSMFPGDLAVGSLKLRVKTQGHKCQLSAPERLKTSQEVNDITNQRICQASSVHLYYFPQKANNPGICQIDLKS